MGIFKRGSTYYAEFVDSNRTPTTKRYSLGTKRKKEALRIYVHLEDAWREGAFDPWREHPRDFEEGQGAEYRLSHFYRLDNRYDAREKPRPVSVEDAGGAFLCQKRSIGRSPNTIRTYREILSLLIDAVGADTPVRSLRASDYERVFLAASVAPTTRHKRFGHLRTFTRWLERERIIPRNPLAHVVPPPKPVKMPKAVTEEELQAICNAVQSDYEATRKRGYVQEGELVWRIPLFEFALYTGMRASELARLKWKHIERKKRLIYIMKQKKNKESTIPLNVRAAAVLDDVSMGKSEDYVFAPPGAAGTERADKYFVERASRAFREARDRAGVERSKSFHGLRHGFCTLLAEAGKSAFVIQSAARHADVTTSTRYVHIANAVLREELDDVFGCGRSAS